MLDQFGKRLMRSVRGWLVLLVASALAPLLVFAGVMLASVLEANERERDMAPRYRARAMAAAVNVKVRGWKAAVQTLAASNDLLQGRWEASDAEARRVAAGFNGWVVLIDAGGQQLVRAIPRRSAPVVRKDLVRPR